MLAQQGASCRDSVVAAIGRRIVKFDLTALVK
jgi:hypothetical protein